MRVEGICCNYCVKCDTDSCPVVTADPWNRNENFCSEYVHDDSKESNKLLVSFSLRTHPIVEFKGEDHG